MNRTLTQRLRNVLGVAVLLFLGSIAGYMILEGYTLLEALYMTVITLSTVGFGEVRPLSPAGRLFTVGVIMVGVGTGAYLFSTLADYIVAGELAGTLRQRRMARMLARLHDHYIVCGFGRVGEQVVQELRRQNLPFVVIDRNPDVGERCERHHIPYITDADNVFVVLSARTLNPNLMIVARATTEDAEHKLLKAGADRVVSPYTMAGYRIVSLLTRPNVIHFLETALYSANLELWLEEVEIAPTSPLVGKTLEEAAIRNVTGANVLAIIRPAEHRLIEWSPSVRLQAGDVLIVLGKKEHLERLADLAGDRRLVRPDRWRRLMKDLRREGT